MIVWDIPGITDSHRQACDKRYVSLVCDVWEIAIVIITLFVLHDRPGEGSL